ncbi:MAG: Na/Pi symporter [Gammaproteobacteria bacterium]|nr:Na/Pi symporter [Gammaproteobacteria bacterium]NND38673.1 Na/Pi cotransporter family protein [Pseudomonadales bacterium]MBT8150933.1 Na/Pi symporter [Gammaproteobacteria bacterium]NNL11354.1 Na/Pi cotransporter family protein [Pseudomonadales bacterium]NNM11023.1 Na/Pi cotransporter family protein [Pseudomonadales bacterium]
MAQSTLQTVKNISGMDFDFWQLIGGVGLFLFAMSQMETALKAFAGRAFRRWLQRYTSRRFQAISVGTLATAVLQSSSLLGLMVLAFVGAGIIALEAALGVIVGANLGTTFTGWLVTLFGFKLDLDAASLPMIGIGSLVFVSAKGRLAETGRFILAFGFLLMGLGLMKDSVAQIATEFDTKMLAGLALWQFLLLGVLLTAIIQSSSATMVIALTALYGNIIELPSAAAMAIGADLGTTTTIVIGALPGISTKKRVALAHVIFNVAIDSIAFIFLLPLLGVVAWLGFTDPMLSLVAFHSLFNVIGIGLFFPFLGQFASWLEQRFRDDDRSESAFIQLATDEVPEAAIRAIEKEAAHLLARVLNQNRRVFTPALPAPVGDSPIPYAGQLPAQDVDYEELYRRTKRLEGEILAFTVAVQQHELKERELLRLNQLLVVIRNAVHAAKSLRDIRHNLVEFELSPGREINAFRDDVRNVMTEFYGELFSLPAAPRASFADFAELVEKIRYWHDQLHADILRDIASSDVGDEHASSLLNVNREVLNSNLAIVMAVKEYHLGPAESEALGELPGAT